MAVMTITVLDSELVRITNAFLVQFVSDPNVIDTMDDSARAKFVADRVSEFVRQVTFNHERNVAVAAMRFQAPPAVAVDLMLESEV